MKWKHKSLFAYAVYRWVQHNNTLSGVFMLKTSNDLELGDIDKDITDNDRNIALVLEKLWSVFASEGETFFMVTADGQQRIIPASRLAQEVISALDKSPIQWPTHFASASDCDAWIKNSFADLDVASKKTF